MQKTAVKVHWSPTKVFELFSKNKTVKMIEGNSLHKK